MTKGGWICCQLLESYIANNTFISRFFECSPETEKNCIYLSLPGYQRELTYQRKDGSFSAFGQSDPSGSMWLTAFVAKSFQQARAFIYVDEATIYKAVDWMITRQNRDGSFPEPGRVIHKEMMVSWENIDNAALLYKHISSKICIWFQLELRFLCSHI